MFDHMMTLWAFVDILAQMTLTVLVALDAVAQAVEAPAAWKVGCRET